MSFLSKLLGGTFEDHFSEGKRLFETGSYGPAKLCLEKALSKSKGAAASAMEETRLMVAKCRNNLAMERIDEADKAAASGELEDALRLLFDATEICDDEKITDAVRERRKAFEAMDARSLMEEVEQIGDDELLTIIAGTWTDDQAEEYASLPETLHEGLLAAHDGEHAKAVDIFKGIMAQGDLDPSPRYLYTEIAKSLLVLERFAEAVEMLDLFFSATDSDDVSLEGRLLAYDMKAGVLTALKRFDEAEECLRQAAREAPEDHSVFLRLGVFLRAQEKYEQSVRILERSRELMGQMQPDINVIRELGFTYLAMEKTDDAIDCFGGVIEHLASRGEHSEFDPVTATTLAGLYEDRRQYQKAADLYRHLAVGYDTASYFMYNFQAARLLRLANAEPMLVETYLIRAGELASTDEEKALVETLEGE